MTTDRMKPDDSPLPLGGLLASGLAAGKHGPNGHVARALDESRATLEAGPDQVGDQRLDDAPPPSPDLAEIIAAIQANWSVAASGAAEWEAARQRQERREGLRCVDGIITDADVERIVWGRVDTYAGKVVRAFLDAAGKPSTLDEPPTRFCWLAGPKGYGKTVAACMAVAKERGRYMTAEMVRRAFCQETREAMELRDYATHCRLLVVDDMGTERNASELADAESVLFHLVNARQGKGRLTILTGNLNEADIYRVYGERTLARICHQGAIVPVKGRDMRRGAQQRSEGGS